MRRADEIAQAPKWTVRTLTDGKWQARHVCLSPEVAAWRWGRYIAAGVTADVLKPAQEGIDR